MATVAATNSATLSATSALQGSLLRSRVEAARRDADQAEALAQALRSQADAQEQVVDRARQRVSSLEKHVNRDSKVATNVPSPDNSATDPAKLLLQDSLTYIKALSELFQFAKPIVANATTASQKNRVKVSLFDATEQALADKSVNLQAKQAYSPSSASTGQVLNASV